MYDIIFGIIEHTWATNTSDQQYIYYTCCSLILLFSVSFIDIIKSVFAQFLRK